MTIPKIIHYCWLSDDKFSDLHIRCLDSWVRHLPDYKFILWNREKFDINSVEWTREAYDYRKYAFAADYIRLFALYHYGGIYLDLDVELLKNLDFLLFNDIFLGFESSGDIEAAVIGSVAHSRHIKKCLDYYKNKKFSININTFDTTPLPLIIRKVLFSDFDIDALNKNIINKFDNIILYPSFYFSPKDFNTGTVIINKDTYSIHHFDSAWVSKDYKYFIKKKVHIILKFILTLYFYRLVINLIRKS